MAIIWQKTIGDEKFEIRNARSSVRLYTNGVFHSQFNPNQVLSKSIWDLLVLPIFFHPNGWAKRILILGVGGGTAIKLIHNFMQPEKIIGIELSDTHLSLAKRFFRIKPSEAELVKADARAWLSDYEGPPFDLIIDDLFGHTDGETRRAVSLDSQWVTLLIKHMSKQGMLIVNTADLEEFNNSAFKRNKRIGQKFKSTFKLTHPTCENRVYVFSRSEITRKALKHNINLLSKSVVVKPLLELADLSRQFALTD